MGTIDEFASSLFEEAKRYLEKAGAEASTSGKRAYCHAAILVGMSSLEAHVNSLCAELILRPDLSVSEQSLLLEREYRFDKGRFVLTDKLRMYRLADRIQFIFVRFTRKGTVPTAAWWSGLKQAIELRNNIVHPKAAANLSEQDVRRALIAVLTCLNEMYLGVFKKRYPAHGRALTSELQF